MILSGEIKEKVVCHCNACFIKSCWKGKRGFTCWGQLWQSEKPRLAFQCSTIIFCQLRIFYTRKVIKGEKKKDVLTVSGKVLFRMNSGEWEFVFWGAADLTKLFKPRLQVSSQLFIITANAFQELFRHDLVVMSHEKITGSCRRKIILSNVDFADVEATIASLSKLVALIASLISWLRSYGVEEGWKVPSEAVLRHYSLISIACVW